MRLVEDKSTTKGIYTSLIFLYSPDGAFELIFADQCTFSWFEYFPYILEYQLSSHTSSLFLIGISDDILIRVFT